MANTFTTNYSLVKSEIGGDNQNWGSNIHNTITAVDSQLVNKLDTEIAKVQTSTAISFTASGRIITAASGNLFEDFKSGDKIKISGASNGGNNGTHVIASKTNQNTIVITAASTLADESAGQTISYNLVFEPATIDAGVTTVDSLTVEGATSLQGDTTIGNAASDDVIVTGKIKSNLIPESDATYDLGGTGSEWNNLYITGAANVDSLVADTVAVSAGTITGITSLSVSGTSITITGTSGDYTNFAVGSNGAGKRTISTSGPSGGDNGDVHYEY